MGVVPILNSPAGTYISTMSSFCEVRVALTPSVGEGAGVDVGTRVGADDIGAADVRLGMLVGADTTGVAIACGAAVGIGAAVVDGRNSAQAVIARIKEMTEI